MWKYLFVLAMALGAYAQEYHLTDVQRDQIRNKLREQCTKNGAEDKIDDVQKVGTTFVDCLKDIVNVEQLKKEVEEAKPNGALDEVFKKYCAKSPQLKGCIHALTSGVSPCLDATMRDHIAMADNATDQLLDFVCHKDGDRIAMFIAEQGPECFQEKMNQIRVCAEKMKESVGSIEEAKALPIEAQCGKFDTLASCVTKALEGCANPTPANMAESLFRFVRNGSQCKNIAVKKE